MTAPLVSPLTTLDAVAYRLVKTLSEALADPQTAQPQRVFQTSQALCAHLLAHYAELPATVAVERAFLAPWQERLAKDLMLDRMGSGLSITQLARECSLSRSHFSRAFKKNTGLAPREWLVNARIERAQALLVEDQLSLAQIGLDCGFADQPHFTRVFTRRVGTTPFGWRRLRRLERLVEGHHEAALSRP